MLVRSGAIDIVVIDSVAPPDKDSYATGAAGAMSAIHALAADCAVDPACAALLLAVAATCNFLGLRTLPLAEATTLILAAPFS